MVAYRIDIMNGDWVDEKYRIVRRIGSGSFGDVYQVTDCEGQNYALKLLRLWEEDSANHEMLIAKFEKEYNAAKLSSDYLIHSIELGNVGGNPYFLMEYCEKGSLSNVIGKDVRAYAGYARDILEGLHILHKSGKIHRDLKPDNVLIRNNGKAALTDFGAIGEMEKSKRSKPDFWSRRPKNIHGTPVYMAPEMYNKEKGGITYLATIDIWSFGVMMYEMITGGDLPFGSIQSETEFQGYMDRAEKGEWDRTKLFNHSINKYWYNIIERCLEPDYRNRYQSAYEVLRDMEPIIGKMTSRIEHEYLSRSTAISRLTITQGDNWGVGYSLNNYLKNGSRMLRIGRESSNDIVLSDTKNLFVSRFHFTLEKSIDGSFWLIRDGQWQKNERRWVTSTNGTYLNVTQVSPEGLKIFTGDIITVGEYKIKVE